MRIVYIVLAIIFFLVGTFIFPFSPVTGIGIYAATGYFVYSLVKNPKLQKYETKYKTYPASNTNAPYLSANDPSRDMLLNIPFEMAGHPLAYQYEQVPLRNSYIQNALCIPLGAPVEFVIEPKLSDRKQVRIDAGGTTLGYLPKSVHRDMVHDWLAGGWPFLGYYEQCYADVGIVCIYLAFYRGKQKDIRQKPEGKMNDFGYKDTYVGGYYRKDGTWVKPHRRRSKK